MASRRICSPSTFHACPPERIHLLGFSGSTHEPFPTRGNYDSSVWRVEIGPTSARRTTGSSSITSFSRRGGGGCCVGRYMSRQERWFCVDVPEHICRTASKKRTKQQSGENSNWDPHMTFYKGPLSKIAGQIIPLNPRH